MLHLEVYEFYKSLATFNNKIKQINKRNEIPPTPFLQCFESEIVLGFGIRDVPINIDNIRSLDFHTLGCPLPLFVVSFGL